VLFLLSCLAFVAARSAGEGGQDFALIALLAIVASVLLWFLPKPAAARRAPQKYSPIPWLVVDGSNVLFWNPAGPSLETVAQVLRRAEAAGLHPLVWFDANVGYRVGDCWLGPIELAKALSSPRKRVFVAQKGHPADPFLLEMATQRGARVITNDRFRDWSAQFPSVTTPGFLIQGRFGPSGLEMDLAAAAAPALAA